MTTPCISTWLASTSALANVKKPAKFFNSCWRVSRRARWRAGRSRNWENAERLAALLGKLRRQNSSAHLRHHRGNLHRFAGILGNPHRHLFRTAFAGGDFGLIGIEGAGGHRDFLRSGHLELHYFGFLFLHVEIAEGGGKTIGQRQAAHHLRTSSGIRE